MTFPYKSLTDKQKIRILGADGDGFLEGTDRTDVALVKRGLVANLEGLVVLTNTGIKVRQGLLA